MGVLQQKFQIFKKVGVKFNDLFLLNEWLQGNFSYFAMILPLNFSEILNIFRIRVFLVFFENSRKVEKKLSAIVMSKLFVAT